MPRNLKPSNDVNSDSRKKLLENKASMNPREYRDSLTKATKSIRGIPTNAMQWNRWTP